MKNLLAIHCSRTTMGTAINVLVSKLAITKYALLPKKKYLNQQKPIKICSVFHIFQNVRQTLYTKGTYDYTVYCSARYIILNDNSYNSIIVLETRHVEREKTTRTVIKI